MGTHVLLGLLLTTAGTGYFDNKNKALNAATYTNQAIKNYKNVLKLNGMEDKDTRELIGELNMAGKISDKETNLMLGYVNDIEKEYYEKKGFFGNAWANLTTKSGGFKPKEHVQKLEEATALYKKLAENVPIIHNAVYNSIDHLPKEGQTLFKANLPKITGVPAPKKFDSNFVGLQRDVNDPKFWRGEDLAELHNLDYDVNNYYDLIKAKTQGQVDVKDFESAILANRAEADRTNIRNTYLDTIRNVKANAITRGITQGSRAAAEMEAMRQTLEGRAKVTPQVYEQRAALVDKALRDDARAELTAYDRFEKLAQSMLTDSMSHYTSDVERYGQDILTNAQLYASDELLRGAYNALNDKMAGTYMEGQAAVNAARSSLDTSKNDEYAWMFDKLLSKNDGDIARTYSEMNNYLNYSYAQNSRYGFLTGQPATNYDLNKK